MKSVYKIETHDSSKTLEDKNGGTNDKTHKRCNRSLNGDGSEWISNVTGLEKLWGEKKRKIGMGENRERGR